MRPHFPGIHESNNHNHFQKSIIQLMANYLVVRDETKRPSKIEKMVENEKAEKKTYQYSAQMPESLRKKLMSGKPMDLPLEKAEELLKVK